MSALFVIIEAESDIAPFNLRIFHEDLDLVAITEALYRLKLKSKATTAVEWPLVNSTKIA
jgi:hypothetical protein